MLLRAIRLNLTFSGIVELTIPVSGTKIFSEANSVEKNKSNYRFKRVHEQNKELRSLTKFGEKHLPYSKSEKETKEETKDY